MLHRLHCVEADSTVSAKINGLFEFSFFSDINFAHSSICLSFIDTDSQWNHDGCAFQPLPHSTLPCILCQVPHYNQKRILDLVKYQFELEHQQN